MKEIIYKSKNSNQTINTAKRFAKSLKENCIVILNGDLGAGKTTFTKGLAKGLKIKASITSPTFTIFNQYENKHNRLFHFDMYRLSNENELFEAGLNEYLNLKNFKDKKTICVIEWAQNVKNAIIHNQKIINIDIIKADENTRILKFYEDKQ